MDCFVASAFARWRASADKSAPRNDAGGVSIRISNSRCASAFSRHDLPQACISLSLRRGSRECRMRAAPAVSCANCTNKCAHEHTGQRRTSDIPCAMALRLMTRSPRRIWLCCLRRLYGIWHVSPVGLSAPPQDLTPTLRQSGPHAFAVRFSTPRQHVLKTAHGVFSALQSHSVHDAAASTASHPNVQ